jgi:hypothetical protein
MERIVGAMTVLVADDFPPDQQEIAAADSQRETAPVTVALDDKEMIRTALAILHCRRLRPVRDG